MAQTAAVLGGISGQTAHPPASVDQPAPVLTRLARAHLALCQQANAQSQQGAHSIEVKVAAS